LGDRITYVGLDVHKDGIVVAVAEGGVRGEIRNYGRLANTLPAILASTFYPSGHYSLVTGRTRWWRKGFEPSVPRNRAKLFRDCPHSTSQSPATASGSIVHGEPLGHALEHREER
jgi:hypothetical protein